jgi:hypothetical protein
MNIDIDFLDVVALAVVAVITAACVTYLYREWNGDIRLMECKSAVFIDKGGETAKMNCVSARQEVFINE